MVTHKRDAFRGRVPLSISKKTLSRSRHKLVPRIWRSTPRISVRILDCHSRTRSFGSSFLNIAMKPMASGGGGRARAPVVRRDEVRGDISFSCPSQTGRAVGLGERVSDRPPHTGGEGEAEAGMRGAAPPCGGADVRDRRNTQEEELRPLIPV